MKRIAIIAAAALMLVASFSVKADQTGDCTAGTEFCEDNNQTTTSTATNTNANTNTNTDSNPATQRHVLYNY